MADFTVEDVTRILRECAGDPEYSAEPGADVGALSFTDMGYDSLALLEMAARIQQELFVPVSDDAVEAMTTPQQVVDYVRARLKAA